MSYYSDPTAAMALGPINREFNRLEKKAERLVQRLAEGKITPEQLDKARAQFTGIYKHVLDHTIAKAAEENKSPSDSSEGVF